MEAAHYPDRPTIPVLGGTNSPIKIVAPDRRLGTDGQSAGANGCER